MGISHFFFISYAYICTCIRRHLKETIPSSSITWSEMGKQNVQAENVYWRLLVRSATCCQHQVNVSFSSAPKLITAELRKRSFDEQGMLTKMCAKSWWPAQLWWRCVFDEQSSSQQVGFFQTYTGHSWCCDNVAGTKGLTLGGGLSHNVLDRLKYLVLKVVMAWILHVWQEVMQQLLSHYCLFHVEVLQEHLHLSEQFCKLKGRNYLKVMRACTAMQGIK